MLQVIQATFSAGMDLQMDVKQVNIHKANFLFFSMDKESFALLSVFSYTLTEVLKLNEGCRHPRRVCQTKLSLWSISMSFTIFCWYSYENLPLAFTDQSNHLFGIYLLRIYYMPGTVPGLKFINCEGFEILPYVQANELDCYSFIYLYSGTPDPGSETQIAYYSQ